MWASLYLVIRCVGDFFLTTWELGTHLSLSLSTHAFFSYSMTFVVNLLLWGIGNFNQCLYFFSHIGRELCDFIPPFFIKAMNSKNGEKEFPILTLVGPFPKLKFQHKLLLASQNGVGRGGAREGKEIVLNKLLSISISL